jgi:methylmalonyl-CoA mutase N-terminal domain/subunit
MLRFHTQTAGVQLTAQQPEVNLVRVAVQGLGRVLGGTQSLHTNSYDEAIALPTVKAATLALRTQQVLAYETDVTATVDPFAGSYVVEAMTDEVERGALALMAQVEERGGAVAGIEQGFQKSEIERSAYACSWASTAASGSSSGSTATAASRRSATSRCASTRPSRPSSASGCGCCGSRRTRRRSTRRWRAPAGRRRPDANVLPPMREALRELATVGEVCGRCERSGASTARRSLLSRA